MTNADKIRNMTDAEKQNDIQNKLVYIDIVNHNERFTEYDYEKRIDKEFMTEEDFLRYYGRADDVVG